jgi:hypothetical protein
MLSTFGAVFIYHTLSLYIRFSHSKLNLWSNRDLAYLVRAACFVYLKLYSGIFFFSSSLLYFAMASEFVHYDLAPKCRAAVQIRLFTEKIIQSLYFHTIRALSEIAISVHLFGISIRNGRWDVGLAGLVQLWFFGVAAYAADVGPKCLWTIVRAAIDRREEGAARAVSQVRFEPISLCQC